MSILLEEPSLYPETLLDETNGETNGETAGEPSGRRWWVLYTRARREKAIARDLFAWEIPFYLPLVRKTSAYRRRKVASHLPVFAGYVFLWGTDEERVRSLSTNRVSRVLKVHDPERLRFDLRQLRELIASDAPLTVESRLVPGNRVRVRFGPLAGIEGTVLTRRGNTQLLVAVNFLQQGASVEIDDYLLEPIDYLEQDRPRAAKHWGEGNGSAYHGDDTNGLHRR
jgi:transcription antitermination factor NusG